MMLWRTRKGVCKGTFVRERETMKECVKDIAN